MARESRILIAAGILDRTNEIPKSGIFGRKSKNDCFSRVSNGSLDKVERVERGDTITILRYTKRGE